MYIRERIWHGSPVLRSARLPFLRSPAVYKYRTLISCHVMSPYVSRQMTRAWELWTVLCFQYLFKHHNTHNTMWFHLQEESRAWTIHEGWKAPKAALDLWFRFRGDSQTNHWISCLICKAVRCIVQCLFGHLTKPNQWLSKFGCTPHVHTIRVRIISLW